MAAMVKIICFQIIQNVLSETEKYNLVSTYVLKIRDAQTLISAQGIK